MGDERVSERGCRRWVEPEGGTVHMAASISSSEGMWHVTIGPGVVRRE